MKYFLFCLPIITLIACNKVPRSVVKENNPKYCWQCTYEKTSTTNFDGSQSVTRNDTSFCDKTGPDVTALMKDIQINTIQVGNYILYNECRFKDCVIK